MASPAILSSDKAAATNAYIVGPLIAAFATISWWEATRVVRLYSLPLGAWLLLAPWVLNYHNTTATLNAMLVGALVIGLSLVKGKVHTRLGGSWAGIWAKEPLHKQEAGKQPRV